MNVDGAVERGVVLFAAANEFRQHFAGEDAARALRHRVEKIELIARERLLFVAEPRDPAAPVDFETPEAERIGRRPGPAPKHHPDARQEFARLERFCDIILRADLEADDLVHRIAARRQHDHRRCAIMRCQLPEKGEAIGVRQHEIEKDQIEALPLDRRERRRARRRMRHVELMVAQILRDH